MIQWSNPEFPSWQTWSKTLRQETKKEFYLIKDHAFICSDKQVPNLSLLMKSLLCWWCSNHGRKSSASLCHPSALWDRWSATRCSENMSPEQLRRHLLHSASNADCFKMPDKWGPFGDGQAPPCSHGMRNPRAVNMMDEGNYSWWAVGAHPPLRQSSHGHYSPETFWTTQDGGSLVTAK